MTLASELKKLARRYSRLVLAIGFAAGTYLSRTECAAQPVDATMRTAARDLATHGAEAFDRKDYAEAYDRLKRAFALYPVPSISFLQAKCLVELGRFVEALDLFEETRRMPVSGDSPEAFLAATQAAGSESDLLRPRIPRLLVQATRGGAATRNVSIRLDGRPLPQALLEVDFPVDPGRHLVTVDAPNSASVTRQVNILEKERVVLEVALDVTSGPVPSAGPAPDARTDVSSRRWWGWGALGGSAVGLVGSVVTGAVAWTAKSHLDEVCSPECPASTRDEIDRFRTYRTVSYVAAGAAAALAGVGGYLLLVQPTPRSDMRVGVSPGAVSLALHF